MGLHHCLVWKENISGESVGEEEVDFSRPSFSKKNKPNVYCVEVYFFSPGQTCCSRWRAENASLWSLYGCLQKGSSW